MQRSTAILFAVALVVCTPAWYSISFQIKYVPAELAVGLRFLLAGGALELFRRFTGDTTKELSWPLVIMLICQGLFLFSVNYWLCYESGHYMVTGLIAATVSTMIIPNLIFGKLFLNKAIHIHSVIGALMGLVGVSFLFWDDILNIDRGYGALVGFTLAFSSTFLSVIGTILTGKLLAQGLSVNYVTSRALLIGGTFSVLWSVFKYGIIAIPTHTDFIVSMIYLSFLATALGCILYLRLIHEVGPGMASYLWIAMPSASLAMSTFFEGYAWTFNSTMGLVLVTLGGVFAISGDRVISLIRRSLPISGLREY